MRNTTIQTADRSSNVATLRAAKNDGQIVLCGSSALRNSSSHSFSASSYARFEGLVSLSGGTTIGDIIGNIVRGCATIFSRSATKTNDGRTSNVIATEDVSIQRYRHVDHLMPYHTKRTNIVKHSSKKSCVAKGSLTMDWLLRHERTLLLPLPLCPPSFVPLSR
ncbi:MAG: hypothetical protein MPJ24_03190 [Pirellulaceae bacterium]|nr:hypothetical protein [Pirellulaceae bacterium]